MTILSVLNNVPAIPDGQPGLAARGRSAPARGLWFDRANLFSCPRVKSLPS
jgi:hypothetical protein